MSALRLYELSSMLTLYMAVDFLWPRGLSMQADGLKPVAFWLFALILINLKGK